MNSKRLTVELESGLILARQGCIRNLHFFTITHPRTDSPVTVATDSLGRVYELVNITDGLSTALVNDYIVGASPVIFLLTPLHPVFLILPQIVNKAKDRYVTLSDLLEGSGLEATVESTPSIKDLDSLADTKDMNGDRLFRYNEGKLLKWLGTKVESVIPIMGKHTQLSTEEHLRFACGVVLVVGNFSAKYSMLHFSIAEAMKPGEAFQGKKRKPQTPADDYFQFHDQLPSNPPNTVTIPGKTNKQKRLEKASVGTKSLNLFFVKPP